jgi:hypothetical protein
VVQGWQPTGLFSTPAVQVAVTISQRLSRIRVVNRILIRQRQLASFIGIFQASILFDLFFLTTACAAAADD